MTAPPLAAEPTTAGTGHPDGQAHRDRRSPGHATIPEAVAALWSGQMIIVVDAPDREDEGDLVMAAEMATPGAVNFMATYGRGLVCVSTTRPALDRLRIPPMTATGSDPMGTAFHVGVDHRTHCTTGISASDRAATIRALASPDSVAHEFTQPGHVFPLAARPGGVLERPGHTEASVELVTMAGLNPAAVICEIANADGEMARRPDLRRLAEQHQLPMVTIADLVEHRLAHQQLVRRTATTRIPLARGEFTAVGYRGLSDGREHLALVFGTPSATGALVRVHPECLIGDVFGSSRCGCARRLDAGLRQIARAGSGALIYLRRHDGTRIADHRPELTSTDHRIAAQILADLGIAAPRRADGAEAEALDPADRTGESTWHRHR